ncbi:hypothetical protein DICVIV_08332 [Dictyocaulus viviparus]|uniref:Peptidase aspartic putative domain-containing protein n=1 Tax=Dictyocaulus viviparus TaxID=29172 RepID=A0A0D8XTB7_DICVI|nr:hypothetical protein DICVIV_08332 [Dictyocaulus viviparus]
MQESTSNNGSVKAIEVGVNKSKGSKIEPSYSNTTELDRFRQEPTEQSSTMKVIVGGIRLGTLKGSQTSFLPIGEVTVLDPKTRKLEKISVLLSTGTSVSFIDPALAKTLGLRTIKKSKLQVHTVLSEEVEEEMFCEVKLDAWDAEGQPLSWTLYLYDIFHRTFTLPLISLEDIKFMRQNNIVADFNRKLTVKPSIQLGCDQAWPIFGSNQSFVRLPSGLRLLSTRLGSLFIGRIRSPLTDRLSVDEHSN